MRHVSFICDSMRLIMKAIAVLDPEAVARAFTAKRMNPD